MKARELYINLYRCKSDAERKRAKLALKEYFKRKKQIPQNTPYENKLCEIADELIKSKQQNTGDIIKKID
jgi:hypothetical protein